MGQSDSKLMLGLGKTASGDPYCADLAKMPHLLIAGATGAGKSGCINGLDFQYFVPLHPRGSALYYGGSQNAGIVNYNDIPHLLAPVVVDPKMASGRAQVGGIRDGEPISHNGAV